MGASKRDFLETREAEEAFLDTNDYFELKGMSLTIAKADFVINTLQTKVNELKQENNQLKNQYEN